jgi:uncharacterized membrane protein
MNQLAGYFILLAALLFACGVDVSALVSLAAALWLTGGAFGYLVGRRPPPGFWPLLVALAFAPFLLGLLIRMWASGLIAALGALGGLAAALLLGGMMTVSFIVVRRRITRGGRGLPGSTNERQPHFPFGHDEEE